ncbi:hypothetical protein CFC21_004300 [Triticum aestivum]|uniref:C3H1-type domain-containing protein n=1 Tax=Triticum aestivum TaxID=4565 RepID=A0A3B5Y791_WHEAT|nr:zinc finger CCCH domain-containing protein 27-like [Triticum aestivum]KAF6986562.1 hypothetical protein CFC21_004300 [Triticum aestivum]
MHKGSIAQALDADKIEVPSPKEESNSTDSEAATDTENFEISDDDDDDRNHKHRRREAMPQPFGESIEEQAAGRPFKRRPRISGNGQPFGGADSRGEAQNNFIPKFKRRPGPGAHSRGGRVNQSFRSASAAARPPMARGRGRNGAPWTHHDPRFNTLDMIDFASQMASQGPPTHPNLFMGPPLPSGGGAQNGPWGPYGFMPGMPNGMMDPIHPLGMQGPIQPPLIDLGMPRQRCRDFEERGFCLRGDMCPMEHGVNRIVVEDMQSLSQFNLPVSVPNAPGLGIQSETGTAHVNLTNLGGSKGVPAKDIKSGVADNPSKLNGSTASAVADADVYDPDQPLWNNERPEASSAGFAHTNDGIWNAETSSYEAGWEHANQGFAADDSQNPKSSVWGRIASKRKPGPGKTANTTSTSATGNQRSDYNDDMAPSTVQVKPASIKDTNGRPSSRMSADVGRQSNSRTSHKASRTLYVNGIPPESNRWEALLSHFEKFGQVIDIYVPANSEKAFIQFSKREEAEAALKAPDAVMGNRFIRLWWANRDRITDEGDGRISAKPPLSNSALPQPSSSNRGKDLQSTTPRASSGSSASGPGIGPKKLPANSITSIPPPAPKRQENLEMLEAIRKKQDMLAQQRDELLQRLEKYAKQTSSANSVKQAEAGGKTVGSNAVGKVGDVSSMNTGTEGPQEVAGTLEKKISGEMASSSPKYAPTSTQKPAVAARQLSPLLAPPQNRFKLDNRTTSFRILPPLPPEIANETVLKDHFAAFGELSSVVLEDTEAHNHDTTLKPSLSCSACVTYATRQSAEKAFISGKSCKGHMLRFMWLTASPGSNNQSIPQKSLIPVRPTGISGQTGNMTSESQSPVGKISSAATSGTAAIPYSESVPSAESSKTFPIGISKELSSSSSLSSNVECPPGNDSTMNAVFTDPGVAQ